MKPSQEKTTGECFQIQKKTFCDSKSKSNKIKIQQVDYIKITTEDLLAWQKIISKYQKAKDKAGEHFCSFMIDRGNYLKEL